MTIQEEEYEQIIEDLQKFTTQIYGKFAAADNNEAPNIRLAVALQNLSVVDLLDGLTLVQKTIKTKRILSNGNNYLKLNCILFAIERLKRIDEKYENAVRESSSDATTQLEMYPVSIGKHVGQMYDFETHYEEHYILLDNEFKEVAKIFRDGAES